VTAAREVLEVPKPYLLLDCYLDDVGAGPAFLPLFEARAVETVRVAHEPLPRDLPAGVDRFAGVVVTGSAASVLDGIPWVERLLRLVREATARRVPLLGVCFGHQAMAQALAGTGAVRRAEQPEVGWQRIEVVEDDPLFDATGRTFTTFVSHEDEVVHEVVVERGLRVLARSRQCQVQAIRLPGSLAWGVQFHAEMPDADCVELIHSRARRHPDAALDPAALLAQRVDSTALARQMFGTFLGSASRPS
jgi:GMP synthase (glutamine-hydrolysing)